MKRLLPATALALAVGLAALPASAQLKQPDGERPPVAPPSTQPRPQFERPPAAPQRNPERRTEEDIPTAAETRRCVSNFGSHDKNSDGALSAKELDKFEPVLKRVDTNNDGKISSAEYQSACTTGTLRDRDIKS
jgi:hypothetical protein